MIDPLLRGPFWGSLLLSQLLAIIGVITFFAKKPLLGEVVAHCSYPGAILGLIISLVLTGVENPLLILFIAFILAFSGSLLLKKMEQWQRSDASMTLILSGFFGLGVFLSSLIQQKFPQFYRLAQGYLFGQVSTMTDKHIILYGAVFIATCALVYLFFSSIKLRLFDPLQAQFLAHHKLALLLEALIALCLVLGIRGVGVVLVSSFFVAPAAFTLRFCKTFKASLIAALLMASALNMLAFSFPLKAPIGPVIVLLLSVVSLFTLKKRPYGSLSQ